MAGYSAKTRYESEYRSMMSRLRLVIGLIVLLLIAGRFVFGVALVRDDGMDPEYKSGRPVLFLRAGAEVRRGDVVCLRLPDGSAGVRRVIALAGDSVEISDGKVYVNGIAERGSYSFTRTDARPGGPAYPLLLREGEYFLLGDSRELAVDSRQFGLVRGEEILGRVLL